MQAGTEYRELFDLAAYFRQPLGDLQGDILEDFPLHVWWRAYQQLAILADPWLISAWELHHYYACKGENVPIRDLLPRVEEQTDWRKTRGLRMKLRYEAQEVLNKHRKKHK